MNLLCCYFIKKLYEIGFQYDVVEKEERSRRIQLHLLARTIAFLSLFLGHFLVLGALGSVSGRHSITLRSLDLGLFLALGALGSGRRRAITLRSFGLGVFLALGALGSGRRRAITLRSLDFGLFLTLGVLGCGGWKRVVGIFRGFATARSGAFEGLLNKSG